MIFAWIVDLELACFFVVFVGFFVVSLSFINIGDVVECDGVAGVVFAWVVGDDFKYFFILAEGLFVLLLGSICMCDFG